MKQYLYETHLHTSPVSRCAGASVRESLEFYKQLGYDGVFITNHFIDGNINLRRDLPYAEKINFYFSDYEEGVRIGKELGIKVFCGIETSYFDGIDFLVYGLDKEWFLAHEEITSMKQSEKLKFMADSGALIIHAHPFREAGYIDHIHLFPRHVHGVETYNACRTEFENAMADNYAKCYDLIPFAGSDNHVAGRLKHLGGMCSDIPIQDEYDFIQKTKSGALEIFKIDTQGNEI
jgi:histidinol phosphatase-like PHP family hydrolase